MSRRPRLWTIPFADIKEGQNRLEYELDLDELGINEHEVAENPSFETLVGRVRVELDILRRGRRFLVEGTVGFRARLQCAVCNEEFERDYAEAMTSEYVEEGDVPSPQGLLMDNQERDRVAFQGDELQLAQLVRDTLHLAIPIAPRCREDCKGLCSTCGKDLNEGDCDCPKESGSPFAELNRLKQDEPADA
jgi:uncharacterized protein